MRRGQAMVETVLAVIFITFVFLGLFQVSQLLSARIMLDHAAARAARAKAVGFNDFMCLKTARVAMLPVAGRRLWPQDERVDEASRVPIYLCTDNEAIARGVLEYDRWHDLDFSVRSGMGISPVAESEVRMGVRNLLSRDEEATFGMSGASEMESHFPYYMQDQGL